ncbi:MULTISPECIES: hypothetical protein [Thermomonosporaceae]|uniref:hypothetical protein n=1 Tax=Thermomonosporaceae TaxID=2012 RepID=UPI00255B3049|nr:MULTISPECIES: hypothetical protein [Thermomonosporaceae]MDL4774984.1 hypothetical protein [Actinomadura xylanilytica]
MTDKLECPDCGGEGEQRIGPLRFACRFCMGRGYVGGDYEPAEDPAPGDLSRPEDTPVWDEPVMAGFPGCVTCLGAGMVVHVGDINRPTKMVESRCPACHGGPGPGLPPGTPSGR